MKDFLQFLLSGITNKDDIQINEIEESPESTLFEVTLPDDVKAIVIGSKGKNINSIRNLMNILARRENKKVYIKILD